MFNIVNLYYWALNFCTSGTVCMMSFMLTLNMLITIVFPLLHFDNNISSVSLWPPATSIHRQFGVCFEMVLGLDGGMVWTGDSSCSPALPSELTNLDMKQNQKNFSRKASSLICNIESITILTRKLEKYNYFQLITIFNKLHNLFVRRVWKNI